MSGIGRREWRDRKAGMEVWRGMFARHGSAGVPPAEPRWGAAHPHPSLLPSREKGSAGWYLYLISYGGLDCNLLDSRFRGNDGGRMAGMTVWMGVFARSGSAGVPPAKPRLRAAHPHPILLPSREKGLIGFNPYLISGGGLDCSLAFSQSREKGFVAPRFSLGAPPPFSRSVRQHTFADEQLFRLFERHVRFGED